MAEFPQQPDQTALDQLIGNGNRPRGTREQRRSFRYDVNLPAQAINEWGESCSARVTNISRDGIRLEGDHRLIEKAFPNFKPGRPANQHLLRVKLSLIEGDSVDEENAIELHCSSVYVLREKHERFQVGLVFSEISDYSQHRLEALIDQLQAMQQLLEIRSR